jgi:hypothetical protein
MGTPVPFRARFGLDNLSNVIRNIGNESSISAASAGANALRINSNTLQISDGATWNNVGGGSSALRIVSLTDASTVAPNADTTDIGVLASLSQNTTFATPSGTPSDRQLLQLIISTSVSRTIDFSSGYTTASSLYLPEATTGGGVEDCIGFRYSSPISKWVMIGTTIGAYPINVWKQFSQNVGTKPKCSGNFIVTTTGLTTGRAIIVMQGTGNGVNVDDIEWDGITANGVAISSTQFTCYWSAPAPVMGSKNFNYIQV